MKIRKKLGTNCANIFHKRAYIFRQKCLGGKDGHPDGKENVQGVEGDVRYVLLVHLAFSVASVATTGVRG